jgi:hypothetical protein
MILQSNKTINRLLNLSSGYDIYLICETEGRWELRGQNVSSRHGRDLPSIKILSLSEREAADLQLLCEIEHSESLTSAKEANRNAEATQTSRAAWIKSLPDMIGGYLLNRGSQELTDEYGNFCFDLPHEMPLVELEQWVKENEYIPE